LGKERSSLEEVVNTIVELETGCNDIDDLIDMAVEEVQF
jgi:peptide chain release factor 2